jgi:DNA modification methylase
VFYLRHNPSKIETLSLINIVQFPVAQLFSPPETPPKKRVPRTPEQTDAVLVRYLVAKTQADPNYWSLPNRNPRQLAHALFQYPAMMVPEVQRRLIEAICKVKPDTSSLYEPYVGSGTALVAGMQNGLRCVGQDINPLAVLLARVKTQPYRYRTLKSAIERVMKMAMADISTDVAVSFPNVDKWFRQDVQLALSKLRRAIQTQTSELRPFLWVTLAETIRLTSNDRTSTYKLHARTAQDIENRKVEPIHLFGTLAQKGCNDLKSFHFALAKARLMVRRNTYKGESTIVLQNTQEKAVNLLEDDKKYDLLVTSPPYGDNITTVPYGQHSYLALQWIPLADIDVTIDESILDTTQAIDRKSLGGVLERKNLEELRAALVKKSPSLEIVLQEIAKSEVRDTITRIASFYRDLDECLDKIIKVMNTNAYLCWTVASRRVGDVEVPIDQILKDLLSFYNVKFITSIERVIHHKRMPSRNKTAATMKNERILIFRVL